MAVAGLFGLGELAARDVAAQREQLARRDAVTYQRVELLARAVERRDNHEVVDDLIIVATLGSSGPQVAALIRDGVPPGKLFPLRREVPAEPPLAAAPRGARK